MSLYPHIITIAFWIISFKKVKITDQLVPMMGLLTALFFAATMMNYPIIGGTTIIVSTHDVEALPELADRIIVISHGQLTGKVKHTRFCKTQSFLNIQA